ncbi:hypothetical protein, partial [Flavobacterium akiainvivens]
MKKYYLLCVLGLITSAMFGQGNTAPTMQPLCADINITFPNTTNSPPADPNSAADSYGCLGSEPNPAWFYFQIGTSGNLTFEMEQYNNAGTPIDVDFIAWGPFVGPPPIYGPANLNSNTEVGCSYSGSAFESLTINNAVAGQYYVILMTNFSNQAGQISFEQSNIGQPGAGSTSCAILCPLTVGEDFTLCPNTTANITAQFTPEGNYDPALTEIQWYNGADAIPGAESFTLTINSPGTYTVVITNPACGSDAVSDSVTVTAPDPLPINEPEDLVICATGGAPYTFNLEENIDVILGDEDPNNYQIYFYENQADAIEGFPIIMTPATYQAPGQGETVYVSVMDYFTLCTEIMSFDLFANPAPQPGEPEDLFACDTDNNGTETFDLTAQEGTILAGQDPNENIVTYHTTALGAEENTGAIQTPDNFTTGDTTIYVRMTNADDEDCYSTTSFIIDVTPLPEPVAPADAFACSDAPYVLPALAEGNYYTQTGGPAGNGTLLQEGATITQTATIYVYAEEGIAPNICSGEDSFVVTIYQKPEVDEPAAVFACESYVLPALNVGQYYTGPGGTGDIVPPTTEITTTTTLYIYAQTGTAATILCTDEYIFNITIDHAPVVGTASPIEVCDDNNDGYGVFNITPAGAEIIGNQTGLEVTYHNTIEDAEAGENDVTGLTNYVNTTVDFPDDAENPHVYVRVVTAGTTTNCATVVEVDLIVHPRPEIQALAPYILCDDNNSPDGVEIFDLTTKNGEATSDPDAEVSWYATEGDAIAGTSPLADATAHESATGEVWVRVENGFGCSDVAVLQLVVNPLPVIAQNMDPFYACEDTPGVGLFDFDEIDPVITQGAAGYSVAYYATMEDAVAGADDNYLVSPYAS